MCPFICVLEEQRYYLLLEVARIIGWAITSYLCLWGWRAGVGGVAPRAPESQAPEAHLQEIDFLYILKTYIENKHQISLCLQNNNE